MSKGISLGNLAADGSLTINVSGFSSTRFGLHSSGDDGGGILAIKGGDGTNNQVLFITDPADASHSGIIMTAPGLIVFDALCEQLEFVLGVSTNPDLDLVLFPQPRS